MELEDLVLVGWFPSIRMSSECVKDCTKSNFGTMVGFIPHTITLAKGWMVCVFKTRAEARSYTMLEVGCTNSF
jgi:hypothetical protein